jgi:hypothetical protein
MAGVGHQVPTVSDGTLKGWLNKLKASPDPGFWAVKWVQGAVASGAQQVNFHFRRASAEAQIYGPVAASARQLAEQFVRGHIPAAPADRHWVTALDGLENFPGRILLASREGTTRMSVVIEGGSIASAKEDRLEGAAPNLSLTLELAKRGSLFSSPWAAETGALWSRVKFCPLPVMVGRTLISQRSVYRDKSILMNWMEPAMGNERAFTMQGDPKQILCPRLVSPRGILQVPHRCSLMVSLSAAAAGSGMARAYWMSDGALTGPVRVVGPTGALRLDILCPGDRPGLDLKEWYKLDPASLFPEQLVLRVARRLAGGLDSMMAEAAACDRPIDELIRKGNAVPLLTRVLPTLGRPYNALGGPFHESVKAFSMRGSLELLSG